MQIAINELVVVETVSINPILPLFDLERFSKFTIALGTDKQVFKFIDSDQDPFLVLVRQEQQFHCNDLYQYLLDTSIRVFHEVKILVKNLNLFIARRVIRSQGRFDNSYLPVDAGTPIYLPFQSKLVKLISLHIHQVNYHCGVAQQIWTPKTEVPFKVSSF